MMIKPVVLTILAVLATPTFSATIIRRGASTSPSLDTTQLTPPAPPQGQNAVVQVQLYDGGMSGLSNPVSGAFLGWSIELSIVDTLIGESASSINPQFLNYANTLAVRGGGVTIRVGGNTQDKAILDTNSTGGDIISKTNDSGSTASTNTPIIDFTVELFKAMQTVGSLVKVGWFFGIPFVALDVDGNAGLIVQNSMTYLGNSLLGLQMANEPDLYAKDSKRGSTYGIPDFIADTATMIQRLPITSPIIAGPSVCCNWDVNAVMSGGYLTQFASSIKVIDVIHYPNNNCKTGSSAVVPQSVLASYLSHTNVQGLVSPYLGAVQTALAAGKPFVMMETNTASCAGFPGVSNSFASALWGIDYGMQMAYGNFSYALYHFGGQNAYYNPFTAPIDNTTQWTTGPIFYANLVVAEALGQSGKAQVIDLALDGNNPNRAGYAVYEGGVASRVLLVNYVTESGPGYTTQIAIGGQSTGLPSTTPPSVRVKYLLAGSHSVSENYNVTWSGQTMGGLSQSDGKLSGTPDVQTIQCDAQSGLCSIPVPAPSVALVFLTDAAFANSGGADGSAIVSGQLGPAANNTTTGAGTEVTGTSSKIDGTASNDGSKRSALDAVTMLWAIGTVGCMLLDQWS
ncbi:hypothetical protein FRB93_009077 [Tulasnella sp. JGI-2019a]|nr:hypothetical protein FRB93_009077 [Tulasnella sp. JGI-2019a]